jgi:uncharacterized cupin superfamily protein
VDTSAPIPAGVVVDAAALDLVVEPVPADQALDGTPATGVAALAAVRDVEVGVWEMGVGSMRDTEVDEVFVVLAGRATVEFEHVPGRPEGLPAVELAPGSFVRLSAGMRTVWTVRETLRKVWIA